MWPDTERISNQNWGGANVRQGRGAEEKAERIRRMGSPPSSESKKKIIQVEKNMYMIENGMKIRRGRGT